MAALPTRTQLIRQGATALAFQELSLAAHGLDLIDTIDQACTMVEEGERASLDLLATAEQLLVDAVEADERCR